MQTHVCFLHCPEIHRAACWELTWSPWLCSKHILMHAQQHADIRNAHFSDLLKACAGRAHAQHSNLPWSLVHLPLQVWYDYARWQADTGGGVAQATACLQRAVHALPNCLLLFFALADLFEAQGDVAAAKQVRCTVCQWDDCLMTARRDTQLLAG